MTLLAACEGTSFLDRLLGIGVALAVIAFWIGMVWLLAWSERESEERRALFIILFLFGGVTAVILASVHGVSLETVLLPALIAISALGAGGGLLLRVGILRGAGTALIGSLFLPFAVLVVVLVSTFLGGSCLGEELG